MPHPILLDGRKTSLELESELVERVKALKNRAITPKLVFIRVGEDPASIAYVEMKNKKAAALAIVSETHVLPHTTTEAELLKLIHRLNLDASVHGILIQAPLPSHISETRVFSTVDPRKDVDGFHPINMGKLLLGDPTGFRPCTPAGIHELLLRYHISTEGKQVAILGRGNIVGKPMAAILMQKGKGADATITLLHSRSRDIPKHCQEADIIIAAMGCAHFVKREFIRKEVVIIDVGVNRIQAPDQPRGYKLVGDVDYENVAPHCAAITPNPGGVGPMTIAMLMANTVRAAELLHL